MGEGFQAIREEDVQFLELGARVVDAINAETARVTAASRIGRAGMTLRYGLQPHGRNIKK